MVKSMNRLHNLRKNQTGMVAIPVTIILMIVISLITIGFSTTIRKEQRQALDSQLASQAFYAAESGVNLAAKKLKNSASITPKTDCGPNADYTGFSINDSTAITCLLVNEVRDLRFTGVGVNSKVSLIDTNDGTNVSSIFINWQKAGENASVTGCATGDHKFLKSGDDWNASCNQPVVRVDIIPINDNMTQASIQASQFTAFLYPTKTGSGANYSSATGANNLGAIIDANCSDSLTSDKTQKCLAEIKNVTGVVSSSRFGIRISSVYGPADINVHVKNTLGVQPVLKGAQALVDSTARSVDVVRRVQVRIPLVGLSNVPDFAIASGSGICKRYDVTSSNVTTDTDACKTNLIGN